MENLDLKAYGVSEMTSEEMTSVNGGGPWKAIIKVIRTIAEAVGIAELASEFADGFVEGVKEGYNGVEYDVVSGA